MKNWAGLNNFLSRDRKTLYMVLSIVMVSVLTLTMAYAALSTTLQINGNAEVSAANWDIHLDNVQLNSNSVTTTAPTITNSTTVTFSTTLSKPGDFYEFTIDVVNDGSIDAMIDGVTKTPTLTTAQAKYLNYIVEYQNGEPINNKQLVAKNSFVRLKVKLEFRKDITTSDLPTTSETLDLAFTVNYVQSDEIGTNVIDNGVKKAYEVISGDLQTVGSEVAIGDEHFYIISSDEDSVTMLAKMNITIDTTPKQSSSATPPPFSSTYYWWDDENKDFKSGYSIDFEFDGMALPYIYNSESLLYLPVENYKTYLESQGANIEEARLIKVSELLELGCSRSSGSCKSAPEWVYGTTYWTGVANGYGTVWLVYDDGSFNNFYFFEEFSGVRPVIKLSLSEF